MRKWKIVLLIITLSITLFGVYQLLTYLYAFVPWAVPWVGDIIIATPPKPEITYGEFPISIIYEVNDEVRKIDEIVICEFDGFEVRGESGKYRKWKSYLKSGNESLVFLPITQELTIEVGIFRGSPNYYMGDFEQSKEAYDKSMSDDRYREYVEWDNGVKTGNSFSKEEVWERYKLRILDVQYSPPITNSFK